jgi:hypothetical protein
MRDIYVQYTTMIIKKYLKRLLKYLNIPQKKTFFWFKSSIFHLAVYVQYALVQVRKTWAPDDPMRY